MNGFQANLKIIIISLLSGIVGAMIFVTCHNYLYFRSVAVVKIDSVIAWHLKEYGSREMSDEERTKASEKFAHLLSDSITRIGKRDRVILYVAPAVISDVPDYTETIKDDIRRGIEGGNGNGK